MENVNVVTNQPSVQKAAAPKPPVKERLAEALSKAEDLQCEAECLASSASKRNHDHDHDPDPDAANDNGTPAGEARTIVPAPAHGALMSLAALKTAFNSVDTTSVSGRSGKPMLQFKSRESTWLFGQKRTVPEDGSLWAINPTTFKRGYICFSDDKKVIGERLLPVSQPMIDVATLPDTGFKWQEQWAVDIKCLSGADAGVEVVFKTNTDGGIKAVVGLFEEVRDRLNGGQHDGKIVPIASLEKDSYPHPQYGRTWTPVMTIVDWMLLDGPAPAPAPTSPPLAEQPRRRRVA